MIKFFICVFIFLTTNCFSYDWYDYLNKEQNVRISVLLKKIPKTKNFQKKEFLKNSLSLELDIAEQYGEMLIKAIEVPDPSGLFKGIIEADLLDRDEVIKHIRSQMLKLQKAVDAVLNECDYYDP